MKAIDTSLANLYTIPGWHLVLFENGKMGTEKRKEYAQVTALLNCYVNVIILGEFLFFRAHFDRIREQNCSLFNSFLFVSSFFFSAVEQADRHTWNSIWFMDAFLCILIKMTSERQEKNAKRRRRHFFFLCDDGVLMCFKNIEYSKLLTECMRKHTGNQECYSRQQFS